jgi:hypothetical protein
MKELGTQTQQGYIRMKDLKGMELVSSANRSVSLPSRDLISSRLSLLCLALTASHSSSSPQARTKRCSSSPSLPSSLTSGTTLCMALSRHCPQLPEAHPPFQGPPIDRNDGKRGERGREGREREVWRCSIRVHNQSKETESCPNNVDRETSQALGEAAVGRGGRGGGEGSYGGELSLFIAAILIVFLVA